MNIQQGIKILYVCLGNICRSPAAQAITEQLIEERGLKRDIAAVDSAGLYSGHAGEMPDKRMRIAARRRGIEMTHRARPVRESDFDEFDVIVAMDDSNYSNLQRMAPTVEAQKKVVRMADYLTSHPGITYIPDPYYEGAEGFELVLDLLQEACGNLLSQIVTRA